MLKLLAVSALALTACTAAASEAPREIPTSFDWQVTPADAEGAARGDVQFQFGYKTEHHSSMWSNDTALAKLDGLTAAQLASAGQPVAFTLHRDAGDFRCKGVAGEGRGTGTCVYGANAGFAAELAKRGVGAPDAGEQFTLAMHDMGYAYLDELKRQRYATPTAEDMVKAAEHGAGMRQLVAMDQAGYRFGTVGELVRVRDHGVSARYVAELKAHGYTGLKAEELVRLRDHGVSTSFITQMGELGYRKVGIEDLAKLRDHGVSASFVAELKGMGYESLAPETLARMRDHGISVGFVQRANRDGAKHTPEELIQMRDRGER